MDSSLVQTPINKINSEFVDRATQIVTLFTAHIDANCPHCLELLSKSGLGNQPNPVDDGTATIPEPTRNDQEIIR